MEGKELAWSRRSHVQAVLAACIFAPLALVSTGAGISVRLLVQAWLLGAVGKWLQPSLAVRGHPSPGMAVTYWLEDPPSEEPRRGCWLITLSMGYIRHRLGLFSVP